MKQHVEHMENFRERLNLQKKKLIFISAALFLIILIVLGGYLYTITQQTDAKELESEAYKYYFGIIKNVDISKEQRYMKAAQLFMEAYNKRSNLTYLLNAGYAYDMAGQKDKAIEVLNKVVASNDINFTNLALVRIANIYLKHNEKAEAIKKLNEILSRKSDILKDFALYQLGKIYENENKEESLRYYEKLIKDFPKSPFAEMAKKYVDAGKNK